jgi:RNA recognition motif-containing protein
MHWGNSCSRVTLRLSPNRSSRARLVQMPPRLHSSSIGLGSIQSANEDVMNIYVGNLPFTITEDKLKDLFVSFGEVTRINLITDKDTGEPRGFGFVEMPTQSEAEAAIKGLNGTSIGGMAIQVNIARDRRRR